MIQFDMFFFKFLVQPPATNVFSHRGIASEELQHKRGLEIAQDEAARGVVPLWKDPGCKVGEA